VKRSAFLKSAGTSLLAYGGYAASATAKKPPWAGPPSTSTRSIGGLLPGLGLYPSLALYPAA
jgi:hypothetical protein